MSVHRASIRPQRHPERQREVEPPSHGRLFKLARTIGITVSLLALVLFVATLPTYVAYVHTVCTATSCLGAQLSARTAQALEAAGLSLNSYAVLILALTVTSALLCVTIAVLLLWRASENGMALLVGLMLVLFGTSPLLADKSLLTPLLGPVLAMILSQFFLSLAAACALLVFFLFPNGRFVPGWMRWFVLGGIVLTPILTGSLFLSVPLAISIPLSVLSNILWVIIWLGVIGTQLYRYWRVSTLRERQQTKWVLFGFALLLLIVLGSNLPEIIFPTLNQPDSLFSFVANLVGTFSAILLLPLFFGIAVLGYRLWDIDIIMKRTLVYGILTVSVIGLYILIVVGLGTLLRARNDLVLSLLATGLIAVFFQPVRARVQRAVNRLLFGERENPSGVLSHLGSRLDAAFAPDAVLFAIVETIAQALKLPYAALFLSEKEALTLAAEHGKPVTTSLTMPLTYQGEAIGELHLAPRTPGEAFAPADLYVLGEVARQAGLAVHAVRLAADLQRARERLVLAREEERRRIRRDLHDGIGPTLASFSQRLDTVGHLLHHEPDVAIELLDQLKSQVTVSIADIRRLVYALRPPVLDELGLVPALQEHISLLQRPPSLSLTFEAPETLPPLPAATEVAVYRIALEALTNVERHAQARTCQVSLSLEEAGFLCLDIADDGRGVSAADRAGVGLMSVRERAEELGGQCHIGAGPQGGTLVHARLPVPQEERADRSPDM